MSMPTLFVPVDWQRAWPVLNRELLLVTMALLGVGLVMVASASVAVADRSWSDPSRFFDRQLIYAGLGLLTIAVLVHVPLQLYQSFSFAFFY